MLLKTAGIRTSLSFPTPSRLFQASGILSESYQELPQRDCPGFTPGSPLMASAIRFRLQNYQILFIHPNKKCIFHVGDFSQVQIVICDIDCQYMTFKRLAIRVSTILKLFFAIADRVFLENFLTMQKNYSNNISQ